MPEQPAGIVRAWLQAASHLKSLRVKGQFVCCNRTKGHQWRVCKNIRSGNGLSYGSEAVKRSLHVSGYVVSTFKISGLRLVSHACGSSCMQWVGLSKGLSRSGFLA